MAARDSLAVQDLWVAKERRDSQEVSDSQEVKALGLQVARESQVLQGVEEN
jgi:hypothetical protein